MDLNNIVIQTVINNCINKNIKIDKDINSHKNNTSLFFFDKNNLQKAQSYLDVGNIECAKKLLYNMPNI